jgi:site-specific DNA recombinase
MGRLTLNVLLSFAQFEREVIGERVRDKIAASKKKGLWVGGPIPIGYASAGKKLVIVPEEAETVRLIFARYLELGSIGELSEDLDRRGMRTKRQVLANGRVRGGIRFGTGGLAHLLKNRFYIGEVCYRGEVHIGEHEPILERTMFEAVQQKLAGSAVARQVRTRPSPAILTGRLYDEKGNRMTPTHANKRGVRYRYYVSHALLQNRPREAGSVTRVSAPDIEGMIVQALRERFRVDASSQNLSDLSDRGLIELYVERIVVKPQAIEVVLRDQQPGADDLISDDPGSMVGRKRNGSRTVTLTLPWAAPLAKAAKGILHDPTVMHQPMSPDSRDALLNAIGKARSWIDDLVNGCTSFAEIAEREGKVERHIRLLAPLAFLSPRVVAAIVDGSAPAGLTVTGLAKALPYSWVEQERRFGLLRD